MSALKINNLYRYFGNLQAVNGVTFEVPHGSVCGFVGANGAGKTTTMRILATLDYPTLGSAEVCGINVVHHPAEAGPQKQNARIKRSVLCNIRGSCMATDEYPSLYSLRK